VEAQGFRSETQSGIKVDVSQNLTVNFALQIGAVSHSVEIAGTAPLLSTQDAVKGQTGSRNATADILLDGVTVTNVEPGPNPTLRAVSFAPATPNDATDQVS
jgi:hypothetical protein